MAVVEIFKTNVEDRAQARDLIRKIHRKFATYSANFDLEDCDKILRVKSVTGPVHPMPLIRFLQELGTRAEVLEEHVSPGR